MKINFAEPKLFINFATLKKTLFDYGDKQDNEDRHLQD